MFRLIQNRRLFLFFVLINISGIVFSQKDDDTINAGHFGGAITVINYGISFIPNFTLGKPAAIFDLNIRKRKLSFEPQFRFALDGKPWSFVFWWRYKLLNNDKFQINVGAHPSVVFNQVPSENGVSKETTIAHQYLAGEFAPNYLLSKNIIVGLYYFMDVVLQKI